MVGIPGELYAAVTPASFGFAARAAADWFLQPVSGRMHPEGEPRRDLQVKTLDADVAGFFGRHRPSDPRRAKRSQDSPPPLEEKCARSGLYQE